MRLTLDQGFQKWGQLIVKGRRSGVKIVTYNRYSWVADEEQKTVLGVQIVVFLGSLLGRGNSLSNFF